MKKNILSALMCQIFMLMNLICSNAIMAETPEKQVASEKVITGLVISNETIYLGKEQVTSSEQGEKKASTIESDIKENILTLQNLSDSYRVKLKPTTAITAGNSAIYPYALKPQEHFVTVKYTDVGDNISINSVLLEKIKTPKKVKLKSMAFGLSLTAIILLAVSGALIKVGGGLFIGQDNRYSNSKFQMTIWIFLSLFSYVTLFFQRYFAPTDLMTFSSQISIPENLGILMGISAGSFVGAKAITSSQVGAGTITKSVAANPSLLDLITDDNQVIDLGDLQMFVWTLVGGTIYFLNFIRMWLYLDPSSEVTLPNVDSSLLVLTGVSQAAYIGKKLVTK